MFDAVALSCVQFESGHFPVVSAVLIFYALTGISLLFRSQHLFAVILTARMTLWANAIRKVSTGVMVSD